MIASIPADAIPGRGEGPQESQCAAVRSRRVEALRDGRRERARAGRARRRSASRRRRPSRCERRSSGSRSRPLPGEGFYVPIGHRYLGAPEAAHARRGREVLGPLFADPKVVKVGHDLKYIDVVLAGTACALAGRLRLDARQLPARPRGAQQLCRSSPSASSTITLSTLRAGDREGARSAARLRRGRRRARHRRTRRQTPRSCSRLADRYEPQHRAARALERDRRDRAAALARPRRDGARGRARRPRRARRACAERATRASRRSRSGPASRRAGVQRRLAAAARDDPLRRAQAQADVKRTKTGRSTDADVLEELADEHAAARRSSSSTAQLAKLKGTYVDALPRS